ncbi:Phosphatidylinositol 4-phosphate 5-kinase type-1 alpha [Camelus dromedarius]|uniref:Phosphatidylinositol 4-phosphate 5-kinase type-1 alpha n=1 Tax=Camelus dromedarius TaxID=9838 RepID=A0A5N4CN01_CAMDR|nr:Phosphatidylinositol 4-phosphate 5-kinase type-1 alpha [Camelus dromedarius]
MLQAEIGKARHLWTEIGKDITSAVSFPFEVKPSPSKKFRSGSSFSRRAGPSGNSCVTYQPSVSGEHKAQVTTKAEVEPGVHFGRPDVLPQTPPLEKISEVSTVPDPYSSPAAGEALQVLTASSTLLEKPEVTESEFIHVSVWNVGEVCDTLKSIESITDGVEQGIDWQVSRNHQKTWNKILPSL